MSDPEPQSPSRRGLRLRQKLALILLLAALVPVAIASSVAVLLVVRGLEEGVRAQTDRTLRVALNLVLGHVEEVFQSSIRLAGSELSMALATGRTQAIEEVLAHRENELPRGQVIIADASGRVVAERTLNDQRTAASLSAEELNTALRHGLAYERRVTFARSNRGRGLLVIRAVVPVLDDGFHLQGVVVLVAPLDSEFADRLKAQLAADVVLYGGEEPNASSFVAADGKRQLAIPVPAPAFKLVQRGPSAIAQTTLEGHSLSMGFAPLASLEGERLGMLAVALDQESVVSAKVRAWHTLLVTGVLAFFFALLLAALISRRLTGPLAHLHAGAAAIARGDLDTRLQRETGDEIGDLAEAFAQMTHAVRENQERLAARMRELTTLHEIGRAISSVLGLDEVLDKIVEELAGVLSARRTVLLLADEDGAFHVGAGVGVDQDRAGLARLGEALARRQGPLVVDEVLVEADLAEAAAAAHVTGSLLAVPLEQKDHILGLVLVNREFAPFADNDLGLVFAFADHASSAIQNARLYHEVQKSSEELELKVKERTFELVIANQELERTLRELGQAQAQLVLSERMAGLGSLVAGIAHEINSPAGAIQGAVDALRENVARLAKRAREIGDLAMAPEDRAHFFALVERLAPQLGEVRIDAPLEVRRRTQALAEQIASFGIHHADLLCRTLVEIGATEAAEPLALLGRTYRLEPLVGYLEQYAYLQRNAAAIRTAIRRVTRIVGGLKSYSHLDQAKAEPANLHDGLENTLVILHHELKYGIHVVRKYAELPPVLIYVDELNQVWTNLIHNAVQALGGRGEIMIETRRIGSAIEVAVEDNGPGIPPDVLPRIFEPFFTTKAKGEGTGLGLGIVKQIIDKHGGHIEVSSLPGRTRFTVRLPIDGPPVAASTAVG